MPMALPISVAAASMRPAFSASTPCRCRASALRGLHRQHLVVEQPGRVERARLMLLDGACEDVIRSGWDHAGILHLRATLLSVQRFSRHLRAASLVHEQVERLVHVVDGGERQIAPVDHPEIDRRTDR